MGMNFLSVVDIHEKFFTTLSFPLCAKQHCFINPSFSQKLGKVVIVSLCCLCVMPEFSVIVFLPQGSIEDTLFHTLTLFEKCGLAPSK